MRWLLVLFYLLPLNLYAALGRVSVEIPVSSSANGTRVRDKLSTFIVGKVMVDCSQTEPTILPVVQIGMTGTRSVVMDACFQLRADAETLKSQIQAEWTAGTESARMLVGSHVDFHMCSNGESAPYNDREDARANFLEVRK